MARAGLDKNAVVERAAQLANEVGIDHIQLKTLAESLNIQPPSLYNHIRGLDDLHHELMLYGNLSAGHFIDMRPKIQECSVRCSGTINTGMTRRRASRKNCLPCVLKSPPP